MNPSLSVNARVRAVVAQALPSPIPLVQTALDLLLDGDSTPVLAGIIGCFASGPVATKVGAALNLIQIGLQRLHVGVGNDRRDVLQFDDAAAVLIGDYLTSGAFKLIAACPDIRVLRVIGAAMTTTCELETAASGTIRSAGEVRLDLLRPFGDAAGRCGGLLAGYAGEQLEDAAAFGRIVVSAHALARARADGAHHEQALAELLAEAGQVGRRLVGADRGCGALDLVEALADSTPVV